MEIIIGKTAGFCFGVANAVNETKNALKRNDEIYCLGELVHNKEVIKELEEKGLIFIDNIEKVKKNVIIRAHGEPKATYDKANSLNINVIDLTCPKVKKIHNIAEEHSDKGFYIFLIGQKDHPETIGTISYCGENADIIEKEEDIGKAILNFNNSGIKKLLVISQTTFSIEKFEKILQKINEAIESDIELEIKNTICNATRIRQEETSKIAKTVGVMIVIGGKNSSNTNKLYNISKAYCKDTILIETEKELDLDYIKKFKSVGIIAGASTPQNSINLVVEKLKQI